MVKITRGSVHPKARHPLIYWSFKQGKMRKVLLSDLNITGASLHYWDIGATKPCWQTMRRIEEYTNGEVTIEHCFRYYDKMRRREAA